ncbi:hypothetical protein BKA62DRAFT_771824 [Auriculariales sp. MPI-PUGE-AT-0066]|nr:hypothetical protein BKA62DRAFT_771824 [Auriculariales sp. MPI-PUGE-AT-0066]
MLGQRSIAFFLALWTSTVVVARPRNVQLLNSVPSNAVQLGFDPVRKVTLAYDASGLLIGEVSASTAPVEKRQASGSCFPINDQEIQRLDGYFLLTDYARTEWGDGWEATMANPPDWPESGATGCIDDIPHLSWSEEPTCSTITQRIDGRADNTTAAVVLTVVNGFTTENTVTVTQESSLAIGVKISAAIGIPDVANITIDVPSPEVKLTNSLSTATAFTVERQESQGVSYTNQPGKSCNLDFTVTNCNAKGHGYQKITAHGWYWFRYKNQRKDHWNWAVNMDAVIGNADQRSSSLEFTTLSSAESRGGYLAMCGDEQVPLTTGLPPSEPPPA